MKKSTEESSAVQQPQEGNYMHEIDLESLFGDFFFMWAVHVAGTFMDTVHRD